MTTRECLDHIERLIGRCAEYHTVDEALRQCEDAAKGPNITKTARMRLLVVRQYDRPLHECESALAAFARIEQPLEFRAPPMIAACAHQPTLAPRWLADLIRDLAKHPELADLHANAVRVLGKEHDPNRSIMVETADTEQVDMDEHPDIEKLADEAYQYFVRAVQLLAKERDGVDAAAIIEEMEAVYVPRFLALGAWEQARNVRIWAADGRFMIAVESHQPLDRCEVLMARRLALASSDLYDKSLTIGAFCGHATRAGDPARALVYLVPLVEELEAEHARTGDDVIAKCLESTRNIVTKARAAITTG